MFEKIIHTIFLKRASKYLKNGERVKKFVNYSNAKSIMILFESDYFEKNEDIKKIINDLRKDGKKVMAWGFVNKKEVSSSILPEHRILNKKNADFTGKPEASFIRELEDLQFDILIDLTFNNITLFRYLVLYSNAYFKVGIKHNDIQISDFVLDITKYRTNIENEKTELDVNFIYNQLIFYLKNIQTSD